MPIINNIGALKQSLRENGWHMTAFLFQYKNVEYDVLFEDIDNLQKKEKYASVRLTFIDIAHPERLYSIESSIFCKYISFSFVTEIIIFPPMFLILLLGLAQLLFHIFVLF